MDTEQSSGEKSAVGSFKNGYNRLFQQNRIKKTWNNI
jgi:hypothetical protein